MNGAELISAFIARHCFPKVFLVTGGACAFIVDALGRNPEVDYVCVQHEQAAAMAIDAVWRTSGKVGVSLATSGPGATNLVTGVACSWFDSIPALHITGQVNQLESMESLGINVRQAGFQETDIVDICKSITKYAFKVHSTRELSLALVQGLETATEGRMGPVLIDVPMDVQQSMCSDDDVSYALRHDFFTPSTTPLNLDLAVNAFNVAIGESARPLFVFGAGLGFSGQAMGVQDWCELVGIPYCASWGGLPFIDRSRPLYQGAIGVYGSRQANWAAQSADTIFSFGSRLDNRQRTGTPCAFAPFAKVIVYDIDEEELKKFSANSNYTTYKFDLTHVLALFENSPLLSNKYQPWSELLQQAAKSNDTGFEASVNEGDLNPYFVVRMIQSSVAKKAIIVADCGANLCWVYQAILPGDQKLFTAGGNSPMGYALPASIGAKIAAPEREVICFIGDGGLQMNIQELQTIRHYNLGIKIVVLNNMGYGIIKQFQDAYFESRYEATGRGYSVPNFGLIASAYGLEYCKVTEATELESALKRSGPVLIDIILPENSLITPKVEVDRFIHDQFPYGSLNSRMKPTFEYPDRPSLLTT